MIKCVVKTSGHWDSTANWTVMASIALIGNYSNNTSLYFSPITNYFFTNFFSSTSSSTQSFLLQDRCRTSITSIHDCKWAKELSLGSHFSLFGWVLHDHYGLGLNLKIPNATSSLIFPLLQFF